VLLSGGMDSAAGVAFYLKRGFEVNCIFIDYGQPAAPHEDLASRAIAEHYRVKRLALRLQGARSKNSGVIPARNAFLLMTALMELGAGAGLIAIGIHKGTSYYDCSEAFVRSMQCVFDAYVDGAARVAAPFLLWTKSEIWEFCMENKIPLELTYSCESGGENPCGQCLSCRDLEVLHAG
jgi:7-cyano-7-deazaguanine synthase